MKGSVQFRAWDSLHIADEDVAVLIKQRGRHGATRVSPAHHLGVIIHTAPQSGRS